MLSWTVDGLALSMSSPPSCFPVHNIRSFLSGKWSLQRTITDRSSGIVGVFTGSASLEADKPVTNRDGVRQASVGGCNFEFVPASLLCLEFFFFGVVVCRKRGFWRGSDKALRRIIWYTRKNNHSSLRLVGPTVHWRSFARLQDVLVYREEGEVRFSAPQARVCRATRQYLYVFPMREEEGTVSSSVDVYFEDGRFFHSLSLAGFKSM